MTSCGFVDDGRRCGMPAVRVGATGLDDSEFDAYACDDHESQVIARVGAVNDFLAGADRHDVESERFDGLDADSLGFGAS